MTSSPTMTVAEFLRLADEQYGPFDPAKHVLPPEFAVPAPRPIPAALSQGSHERSILGGVGGAMALGVLLCLFWLTGLNRTVGYFVMGLEYSGWIGLGVILIASCVLIWHYATIGLFVYVRDGIPRTARLVRLQTWVGGQYNMQFGYNLLLELPDPETGVRTVMEWNSGVVGGRAESSRYSLRAKPGDYLTVVSLPGKPFEKSARVYGLLGLNRDEDLVLKDGKPRRGTSAAEVVGVTLALLAIGLGVLAVYYMISYHAPIDPHGAWYASTALCALVLGAIGAFATAQIARLAIRVPTEMPQAYGLLGFLGAAALGMMIPPAVNAGLDRSPPEFRAVSIDKRWGRSRFMFRSYDIEYREAASGAHGWYPSTPERMEEFPASGNAAIEVHQGFLGWPWIRNVHPVMLVGASEENGRRVLALKGEPTDEYFRPVVVNLRDRGLFALRPEDEAWMWKRLEDKKVVTLAPEGT